jgi:hypothetical protein
LYGAITAVRAFNDPSQRAFCKMDNDSLNLDEFLKVIDRNSELRAMRVVYFDGLHAKVVREGPLVCAAGLKTIVIHGNAMAGALQHAETAASRDSRLYVELLSGALGCGSAAFAWLAVAGSAGAVPVTGGASSFITALSYTAATASSLQCATSAVRIYNELESPGNNDWLTANIGTLGLRGFWTQSRCWALQAQARPQ